MRHSKLLAFFLIAASTLSFDALPARAMSVNSNRIDVGLQATIAESLSIAVANPLILFGVVTAGQVNAAPIGQSLAIVTSWNLNAGRTLTEYAYFDSASTALTGALTGTQIPVSSVQASFNGGALQSFTGASPFTSGATALQLYSSSITASNLLGVRTDSLALSLNLTNRPSLASDTYAGTMHIQAQAL